MVKSRAKAKGKTMIWLSVATAKRLKNNKITKRESYDEIINRVLNERENKNE